MTEQEKYALIVKLRDSGKNWWDISEEIGGISMEMCRYRYKQAKGLLKPKNDGMDLRDYFAGKAMQGLVDVNDTFADYHAKIAYRYADAMMKARKNEKA